MRAHMPILIQSKSVNLRPHWREDLTSCLTTSPVMLFPVLNFLYLDVIILEFISRKDHTKNKKNTVILQSTNIFCCWYFVLSAQLMKAHCGIDLQQNIIDNKRYG